MKAFFSCLFIIKKQLDFVFVKFLFLILQLYSEVVNFLLHFLLHLRDLNFGLMLHPLYCLGDLLLSNL